MVNTEKDHILTNDANTHNLKHLSIKITKHKISVFTGVSGSRKTSLVFSTLAAESQRHINKTYSAYIQQLLPRFENPEVTSIKKLSFSIIVNQKQISGNIRSAIGTFNEIYTGLRLLFSRLATPSIGYSMVYSFNNTDGMYPYCQGTGVITQIDIKKLVLSEKSLNQGAIVFPTFRPGGWRLSRYTESGFFDSDLPLKF